MDTIKYIILIAFLLTLSNSHAQQASGNSVDEGLNMTSVRDSVPASGTDKALTDSIKVTELDGISVEADRMNMSLSKVSYYPTGQQRNASSDGITLLHHIGIPQLIVNPLRGTVTTNGGESVSFFIDGVPASAEDVADMNTRDVIRVEVIDYPVDPIFRDAAHVVNYIMQKYEYGGYTKLNSTEIFLNSFQARNTVNSKMVYKRMTFDARAGYNYYNNSHNGADKEERFRLPGYGDIAPDGISRRQTFEDSKFIRDIPSASFRALYQSPATQLSSTLNWSNDGVRTDRRSGSLHYSPDVFNADRWNTSSPSRKNNVKWNAEFYQQLPSDWALSASFSLSYSHVNQSQKRIESDIVVNDLTAVENAWSEVAEVDASKRLNNVHKFSVNFTSSTYRSDIDYTGTSTNTNRTSYLALQPGVSYSFMPSNKFFARLAVNAMYYHAMAAGVEENRFSPGVNLNLTWMPHRRHRVGAVFQHVLYTPTRSQTNPVLIQSDLLMWSQGNPELRTYPFSIAQMYYTWNPSPNINISPVVTWVHQDNYIADTYALTDDGKGILVKPENCGNYHNIWGSVNFTSYLFNRKLALQATPWLSYHKFSGIYNMSRTTFYATVGAYCYFGQFYVGATYTFPHTSFDQGDPVLRKSRSEFWLNAGWGNASWTVSAQLVNPFRSHWRGQVMTLDTPCYSLDATSIGLNDHRYVYLTVAYTFGYGKKIQKGNDLNEDLSGSESSIR